MALITGVLFLKLTKVRHYIYQKCQKIEQENWNNTKYDDFYHI